MSSTRATPRPPAPGDDAGALGSERDGLQLIVSSPGGVESIALSNDKPTVIGREPGCDVVVHDDSVSRRHAVVHPGSPPKLEDLGSTNGTFLLGRQLEPHVLADLPVGSVAQLGLATLVVQRARAPITFRTPIAMPARTGGGASATMPPPLTAQSEPDGSRIVVDPVMQNLYRSLASIGPTTLSVLILGETGTGKEVFAQAMHEQSRRAGRPFLKLNCGALPESILESELFGHERGAFTGAVATKLGLFESADGGTVFLDEVGELSRATQVKLLRVLETGEVLRIGSVKPKQIDVRLLSATNRNLNDLVASAEFRMDLLFRINGFTVTIPPLRERRADVAPLARFFIARAAKRGGIPAIELTSAALAALEDYSWPGNIRELRNVIDRAVALCPPDAGCIDVEHLFLPRSERSIPPPPLAPASERSPVGFDASPFSTQSIRLPVIPEEDLTQPRLRDRLQVFERERIEEALERSAGHQGRAAQLLGISRRTLFNKMEQLGIRRPRSGNTDPPGAPPSSRK